MTTRQLRWICNGAFWVFTALTTCFLLAIGQGAVTATLVSLALGMFISFGVWVHTKGDVAERSGPDFPPSSSQQGRAAESQSTHPWDQ